MWEVKGALSDDSIASAASTILDVVVQHKLDGIVLELGEVWYSGDDAFRKIVHKISQLLKGGDGKNSYSLIVVVPMFQMTRGATLSPPPFPYLEALLTLVDGVTLNTYDYTVNSGGVVGPNAPYYWHKSILKDLVSKCDSKAMIGKIMLGVPLYGRDNQDALLSVQVLDKIRDSKADIRWNLKSKEHYIRYKDAEGKERTVHFPSLLFLKERIDLANRLGVGISLWEMGQGLDYFYNLL
jgi:chitinase domain-containing protein 1